ncbi:hypothetical protein M0R89_09645 [Halorussus limi]|uniref:DUF7344 domain-containing protein n=1 Tax=Halorussus limi TaxID=2938695 RepID=A0A8U0HP58_9EURY|nr:hypothetical protein [Halorussus limi]UPV72812.1 hypothetical protein M0R89_09645 [Halorussus limi]
MSNTDSDAEMYEWNGGPNLGTMNDSTLNQAFDLLRNQRRRYVLKTLHTEPETVFSVDKIADNVLTHDPEAGDRDSVLVDLHHKILPRLADESIIDFDARTGTVRYRGGELVDDLLVTLTE